MMLIRKPRETDRQKYTPKQIQNILVAALKKKKVMSASPSQLRDLANLNIPKSILHGHVRSLLHDGRIIEEKGRYYHGSLSDKQRKQLRIRVRSEINHHPRCVCFHCEADD